MRVRKDRGISLLGFSVGADVKILAMEIYLRVTFFKKLIVPHIQISLGKRGLLMNHAVLYNEGSVEKSLPQIT